MSRGVAVGLTNLVYAVLKTDNPPVTIGGSDGEVEYDEAVRVLGAITANFSPNASNDTLFADDGPFDTASTFGAMSLELNVADIPPKVRAELLGADYDENTGILTHTAEDIPPYVAVGMSVKKSNGADRLIWYLKGKFTAPDDNNQTKADSINWNTPTISGNFLKRNADQQWRVAVDTDDANVKQDLVDAWFESPNVSTYVPEVKETVAVPAFTPASGNVSNLGGTNIVIASDTASATIEYKFSTESEWKKYPSGGIDPTGLAAGPLTVNARASKEGMLTSYANATYTITSS